MNPYSKLEFIQKKLKDIKAENPDVYIFRLPQDQEAYDNHNEKPEDITIAIRKAVAPNEYPITAKDD